MAQINGFAVWLTGMSGTGKSALANYVAPRLHQVGRSVQILDEAAVGQELWPGMGDSKEERTLVVRRIGYLASMLSRNNVAVLVAAVSPYKAGRDDNRRIIGRYIEVFVDCPTDKLIQRDTTGRYRRALAGEIPNFIGITEPYEPPANAEVTVHSDSESIEEGARKVFQALLDLGCLRPDEMRTITGHGSRSDARKKARRSSAKPAAGARKARPSARAARVVKASKKAAGKRKAR
jgi:adenylylsulfate kinase